MERLFDFEKKYTEIDWLKPLLAKYNSGSNADLMRLAISISEYSAKNNGGPFGAVIADNNGNIVECGCNEVVLSADSTCHAEINVIRRAQRVLQTHDLSTIKNVPLTLYTSCAPCIQCFGAIYWSGIKHVIAGALKEDAETVGFSEGCISQETWLDAKENKGISYELGFLREEARQVLLNYQGRMY